MWNAASDLQDMGLALWSVLNCDCSKKLVSEEWTLKEVETSNSLVIKHQEEQTKNKNTLVRENVVVAEKCTVSEPNESALKTVVEKSPRVCDAMEASANERSGFLSPASGPTAQIADNTKDKNTNSTAEEEKNRIKTLLQFNDDNSGMASPTSVFEGLIMDHNRTIQDVTMQMKHYHPLHASENISSFKESEDDYLKRQFEDESQAGSIQFSVASSMHLLQNISEEADLDFIDEYDVAFSEFLTQNSQYYLLNPDLAQKLRVLKLQKILERQAEEETKHVNTLKEINDVKRQMTLTWHEQLRNAARQKAARETFLQSYLGGIHYQTKTMEAQLTWKLIRDTENSMKRLRSRYHVSEKQSTAEENIVENSDVRRYDMLNLLEMLSGDEIFDSIRNAALAPAGRELSSEQRKDLHQFQIDNVCLRKEVAELHEKLAQQRAAAKKFLWVESVLLRMDEKSFKKLKSRFKKRTGVPLSSSMTMVSM